MCITKFSLFNQRLFSYNRIGWLSLENEQRHLTALKAESVLPVFLLEIQNLRPHSKPNESDLCQCQSSLLNWLYLPSVTESFNLHLFYVGQEKSPWTRRVQITLLGASDAAVKKLTNIFVFMGNQIISKRKWVKYVVFYLFF